MGSEGMGGCHTRSGTVYQQLHTEAAGGGAAVVTVVTELIGGAVLEVSLRGDKKLFSD